MNPTALDVSVLEAALTAWSNGATWEAALGLNRRQYRNRRRDDELRRALELLGGDIRALHGAAIRFESQIWPRWKRSGLPTDAGGVNAALFRARQYAGNRLPISLRHYFRILDRNPPC